MSKIYNFDMIEYLQPITIDDNYSSCKITIDLIKSIINTKMEKVEEKKEIHQPSSGEDIDKIIRSIKNNNFNYLRIAGITHHFFIEKNGSYIRILSLYCPGSEFDANNQYGFDAYNQYSKFGKYFKIGDDIYKDMIKYFDDIINFESYKQKEKSLIQDLKMYKAIYAWIALFGIRKNGDLAIYQDEATKSELPDQGPKSLMNKLFDAFQKKQKNQENPNIAASLALESLFLHNYEKDLNEKVNQSFYNELYLILEKIYKSIMNSEGTHIAVINDNKRLQIVEIGQYKIKNERNGGRKKKLRKKRKTRRNRKKKSPKKIIKTKKKRKLFHKLK
jgi:hypothetical protein